MSGGEPEYGSESRATIMVGMNSDLLSYAEVGEDAAEDVVGGDFAGEGAEFIEGGTEGSGDEFYPRKPDPRKPDLRKPGPRKWRTRRFVRDDERSGFFEMFTGVAQTRFVSGLEGEAIGGERDGAIGELVGDVLAQLIYAAPGLCAYKNCCFHGRFKNCLFRMGQKVGFGVDGDGGSGGGEG